MNTQIIITELINKGYNAELTTTNKNGVIKEGITIKTEGSNVAPIIYTDLIIEQAENIQEAVEKVIEIYEEHKTPAFITSDITSPEFMLNNLFVGVQKVQENVSYIHRPTKYEGIEEYLYVRVDENGTYKLPEKALDSLHKSADELFEVAHKHTFENSKLVSMADMLGMPIPEGSLPLYVLTNKNQSLGASAMLDDNAIKLFAKQHNVDEVVILPSSIHEVILTTLTDEDSIEMFSAMVTEVNASEVAPEEQLIDKALIYKVA